MVWPTLGSKTAKEQNMELHIVPNAITRLERTWPAAVIEEAVLCSKMSYDTTAERYVGCTAVLQAW